MIQNKYREIKKLRVKFNIINKQQNILQLLKNIFHSK